MLKFAGCAAPLVPAPTVTSTHENSLPLQPEGLSRRRALDAAVQLLPHLVEAMHRARRVGVVGERAAVGQLERSGRQIVHVGDARIGRLARLAGAAAQQIDDSSLAGRPDSDC